tara:strand:+ start:10469 stop:10816 length:348 start_codon:yes stop_codon:yes gene_type:complete
MSLPLHCAQEHNAQQATLAYKERYRPLVEITSATSKERAARAAPKIANARQVHTAPPTKSSASSHVEMESVQMMTTKTVDHVQKTVLAKQAHSAPPQVSARRSKKRAETRCVIKK